MKYCEIGFNAEHLSKLSRRQFDNEVKKALDGDKEKMDELWTLIRMQYPAKPKQGETP